MTEAKVLAEAKRKFLCATQRSRWRFGDTPEGFFHSSSTAAYRTRKYPVFRTTNKTAKDTFKVAAYKAVRDIVKTEGYGHGRQSVPEISHYRAIKRLADGLSREGATILAEGCFRIGVAQKLLNMYLKYLWAYGKNLWVDEKAPPPHCPFDRVVIYSGKGNLWRYMADKKAEHRWTVSYEISDYKAWVAAAEQAAKASGFASIAEWELITYNKNILR